jgi:hypothetical protein
MTDFDQEYRGPATLVVGNVSTTLEVRLSAHFEPVEGRYHWAGRTEPHEDLLARVRAGARAANVRINHGLGVTARLGEPDPWGGIRLTGIGKPPW